MNAKEGVHIREVEFEVELPRRRARRIISILVHEREPELDDLQEVDVTPQQLVLVVYCAAKLTDRSDYHSGEFCVLVNNEAGSSLVYNALKNTICSHSASSVSLKIPKQIHRNVLHPEALQHLLQTNTLNFNMNV